VTDTSADVFHRGTQFLLAKDMAAFIALFAEDAVMEIPFAPPGRPNRLVGRKAVHDYLIDYPSLLDVHHITDVTLHRTTDPDVIVAEFTADGLVIATGQPYDQRYVTVMTVRNGQVVHYRDYWNPLTSPASHTPHARQS
jgi:uncharacterized protein